MTKKTMLSWILAIASIGIILLIYYIFNSTGFKDNPYINARHFYFIQEIKNENFTTANGSKLMISSLANYKNACNTQKPKTMLDVKCLAIAVEGNDLVEAKSNIELLIKNLKSKKNNTAFYSQYSDLTVLIYPYFRLNNYEGGVTRYSIRNNFTKLDQPYLFKIGD